MVDQKWTSTEELQVDYHVLETAGIQQDTLALKKRREETWSGEHLG